MTTEFVGDVFNQVRTGVSDVVDPLRRQVAGAILPSHLQQQQQHQFTGNRMPNMGEQQGRQQFVGSDNNAIRQGTGFGDVAGNKLSNEGSNFGTQLATPDRVSDTK